MRRLMMPRAMSAGCHATHAARYERAMLATRYAIAFDYATSFATPALLFHDC